jgi:hypothetical protein
MILVCQDRAEEVEPGLGPVRRRCDGSSPILKYFEKYKFSMKY